MPWNRLPPPSEPKKRAFFSRPKVACDFFVFIWFFPIFFHFILSWSKVSWALVEQPSEETSCTASDLPTSKTKIQVFLKGGHWCSFSILRLSTFQPSNLKTGAVQVLPVDGSFSKKSEYQQQQEEQQQELLEEMAKEVILFFTSCFYFFFVSFIFSFLLRWQPTSTPASSEWQSACPSASNPPCHW